MIDRGGPRNPYVSLWECRAEGIIEEALGMVRDRIDAISTLEAALVALRIDAGDADPSELDGYKFDGEPEGYQFDRDPDEPDDGDCICPPEMVARNDGSFRGGCPVHG